MMPCGQEYCNCANPAICGRYRNQCYPVPTQMPFYQASPIRGPWVCPKCQRVYGPDHGACFPCNKKVDQAEAKI